MSEETYPTTPETAPNGSEIEPEKKYVAGAYDAISKAENSAAGTNERFLALDSYIDGILQDADNGEVAGSDRDYTKQELLMQFEAFINKLNMPTDEREGPNPYRLITRANGLRDAFVLLMDNDATYRDFEESLKIHIQVAKEGPKGRLSENSELPSFTEMAGAATGIVNSENNIAEESELETAERFVRECKAELDELYAKHRVATPGSDSYYELEGQIKVAKEDLGGYAGKVARLKGSTNWS